MEPLDAPDARPDARPDGDRLAAFLASNAAHREKLTRARLRDEAKQAALRQEFGGDAIEQWRADQEQALADEAAAVAAETSEAQSNSKVEAKSEGQ